MLGRNVAIEAQGRRYRLGRTADYGGIWRRRPWGWQLLCRYPLTDDGWRAAHQQYEIWEPTGGSNPEGLTKRSAARYLVPGAAVVVVVVAVIIGFQVAGPSHSLNVSNSAGPGGSDSGVPSSPAAAPASGYLATGDGYALFLQWNNNHGTLSGTLQGVGTSGTPPNETSSNNTVSVSGTLNGNSITLSFDGGPSTFGTVSNGSFSINVPQRNGTLAPVTFHSASAQDFNNAVTAITDGMQSANAQATQINNEANNINETALRAATDVNTLSGADFGGDSGSLGNGAGEVSDALKQEQSEYAQFQSDLANNNQYGQACTDVGGSLNATLGGSVYAAMGGTVVPDANVLQSHINSLRQLIQTAPADIAAYRSAQASLPSFQPKTPVGPLDPALNTASTAIGQALAQANPLIDRINSDAQQAYQLTSNANKQGNCGLSITAPTPVGHIK